jgi:hypothetical protein
MKLVLSILLIYFVILTYTYVKDWIFYKSQKIQLESTQKNIHDTLNHQINRSLNLVLVHGLIVILFAVMLVIEVLN